MSGRTAIRIFYDKQERLHWSVLTNTDDPQEVLKLIAILERAKYHLLDWMKTNCTSENLSDEDVKNTRKLLDEDA